MNSLCCCSIICRFFCYWWSTPLNPNHLYECVSGMWKAALGGNCMYACVWINLSVTVCAVTGAAQALTRKQTTALLPPLPPHCCYAPPSPSPTYSVFAFSINARISRLWVSHSVFQQLIIAWKEVVVQKTTYVLTDSCELLPLTFASSNWLKGRG